MKGMIDMDKQSYYEHLLTLPREELKQMLKDVIRANNSVPSIREDGNKWKTE
jgi:hypothetical protein